ncbi:MAG: hypothetical protein EBZ49_18060, partial [Proteobacteria bacterium]|nr:hypothetical protein [Pseudomonadota bacterium]
KSHDFFPVGWKLGFTLVKSDPNLCHLGKALPEVAGSTGSGNADVGRDSESGEAASRPLSKSKFVKVTEIFCNRFVK